MVYKWQSGKTDNQAKVVASMEQAGLDVDTPFDAMSTEGKERIAQMMSHLAISESGWKITPQEILQVVGSGSVKQASTNANMQRIDSAVYDATKQANNNGVRYSMGGKDIGSKEGIYCSGWVTELLDNHVFKAENGFKNKVKDALGSKANPKTAAGIIKSLGGLANEELQGDVLTPDQIKPGLVIGITATSAKEKARTAKFYKGISHIVYTFENNGQVYITESSRSSGVHSMPYTDWYNERVKNGAQLYGVDVNRLRTSSDHNRGESTYANKTPSNEQTNAAKGQSLGFTGGLIDPNKAMVLQGRIDAGRRQHAAQANLTASAFDNHIAFGMETGDFSRAQNDLAALRRLGMHKEAKNLDGLLTLAQTANGVLVNVNDLPLLDFRHCGTSHSIFKSRISCGSPAQCQFSKIFF